MRSLVGVMGVVCAVTGCSDDPPNTGFTLPTAPLVATGSGGAMLAPAIGCGPIVPTTSTHAVTVNGEVIDYLMTTKGIAATIAVYNADDFANPIVTATSAANGAYSVQIPTAMPDLLYAKITATDYLDIYDWNLRPDLTQPIISKYNVPLITADERDQLYGLVRVTPDPKKSTLAAVALDCNKNPLQHAVAVISTVSGKRSFLPGAQVFYTAAGMYPVPELTSVQADTNDNGTIAILNITVTKQVFLQVWGFPDDAAFKMHEKGLVLIAEYPLLLAMGQQGGINAFANQ